MGYIYRLRGYVYKVRGYVYMGLYPQGKGYIFKVRDYVYRVRAISTELGVCLRE